MTGVLVRRVLAIAGAAIFLVGGQASLAAASPHHGVAKLRDATAKYHRLSVATDHGYAKFSDTAGISCIAMHGMGGMGVHYVNGDRVGDPAIVATKPEALVYRPDLDGKLHLAAVEYIVDKAAWDATHQARPRLYGHRFNVTAAPNRYGLPTFYSLHVWAWKHNPAGLFAMWNPTVHCDC